MRGTTSTAHNATNRRTFLMLRRSRPNSRHSCSVSAFLEKRHSATPFRVVITNKEIPRTLHAEFLNLDRIVYLSASIWKTSQAAASF